MSKKTRSQKAARKTKTADFEIFEDRSPQERGRFLLPGQNNVRN